MWNGRQSGVREASTTWVVLANRDNARIFKTNNGAKHLELVREIAHPEGRMKNGELTSDRDGKTKGEGSANFPMGGLVNKGEAVFHETEMFARHLSEVISKARAENHFNRLVLVAEPKFLGVLRGKLDGPTEKLIQVALDKEWSGITEADLRTKLDEMFLLAS